MSDIIFESSNLLVVLITFGLLLKSGRKMRMERQRGWYLIVAGFSFLVLGNFLDVLDEFPYFAGLDLFEEALGTLPGYILLSVGFYLWFPEIIKLNKAEDKLRKHNDALAHRMDERKQAMRELAKARDLAEDANQSKDAFLATMSHEIRTPMNIVLGMHELLKDADLTPKFQEYLHLSITAGKRLLFLINDLLDFAQIDQGKFVLDKREFDLRKLMDEVTMIMAPLASAKGVELTAHISGHLPTNFYGDPNRLGQIFTNLLTNAIKFTPAGGSVDLHGGPISNNGGKTEFLFEIRDTGEGIPPEKRDAIFNRFTQIDNSTTRAHEGTGLGLAISKHLIQLMDGEIGIDNNIHSEVGSTFFFSVVLENQKKNSPINYPTAPLQGYLVYLFGCDGLQLTMLTDHLEQWGAKVYTENSINNPPQDKFNLVIVNHKPGSGDDFIPVEHLTEKNRLLVLTDLLDQAWDQAATTFVDSITCLQKPVSSNRLLKAILNPYSDENIFSNSISEPRINPDGSIMVVDDQTTNLLLTKAMLEKIGFCEASIDLAESGRQALELAIEKKYQLILLDLRMPNMDGYQTARALRAAKSAKSQNVPIIAYTGDITKKSIRKCTQSGMAGLLAKPTSLSDLKTVIQEHFSFVTIENDAYEETTLASTTITDALETMGLPPENHREVAEVLVEQIPSLIKGLEKHIQEKDEEQSRATAHVLKGSMANVLFTSLKEPSLQIHKSIRKKEWRQAKKDLANYQSILNPIMRSIQEFLASSTPEEPLAQTDGE